MANQDNHAAHEAWILEPEIQEIVRHKSWKFVKARCMQNADQPDVAQELLLHLVRKSPLFDPDRSSRSTFATRIIKHKLASIVRKQTNQKCLDLRRGPSLNQSVGICDGRRQRLADTMEDVAAKRHTGQRRQAESAQVNLKMDIAEARQALPAQLQMMAALLSHVNEFAAAQVLRISRRQAAAQVLALREHFEAHGLTA